MSYEATVSGNLTLREYADGEYAGEEQVQNTLKRVLSYSFEWDDKRTITLSGRENYHEEDFGDLAGIFNGELDFEGEDGSRWTLFLKDGTVTETTPIEIGSRPGEIPAETLGRYIAEMGINPRQVLEAMPDFITGKLWFKADVLSCMEDCDVPPEIREKILDRAIELSYLSPLEECTDEEWGCLEEGIMDALEEYNAAEAKKETKDVFVYYAPRLEVTNGKKTLDAERNFGGYDEPSKALAVAKCIRKEISEGKFNNKLTPEQKKAGYYLNVAIETIVNGSVVDIKDLDDEPEEIPVTDKLPTKKGEVSIMTLETLYRKGLEDRYGEDPTPLESTYYVYGACAGYGINGKDTGSTPENLRKVGAEWYQKLKKPAYSDSDYVVPNESFTLFGGPLSHVGFDPDSEEENRYYFRWFRAGEDKDKKNSSVSFNKAYWGEFVDSTVYVAVVCAKEGA